MKKSTIVAALLAGLLSGSASFGSGFSILEQSVAGMGRSLAGMTAATDDPAAQYFNPSAPAWLGKTEMSLDIHALRAHAQFDNKKSTPALGHEESGDQGGWTNIPNFYLVHPITSDIAFGLGMSATSGTKTDYNPYWIGRYTATETEIAVIDVVPTISWKIRDDFSIGLGLVTEYADTILEQQVDLSPYGIKQSDMKVTGDGVAFGFSLGMTYEPVLGTKIGLGYRSRMNIDLDMTAKVRGDVSALKQYGINLKSDADAELKLPSMVNFGISQNVGENWRVMADICWTEWSVMDELTVKFKKPVLGQKLSSQKMKWRDNWRIALGGEYKMNSKLTWRAGVAFDEAPSNQKYKNTRLPDADRYWISVGLGYQATEHVRLDASFMHLFFENGSFKQASPVPGSTEIGYVQGKVHADCNIISVGMTYTF